MFSPKFGRKTSRWAKYWSILILFNLRAATIATFLAAVLVGFYIGPEERGVVSWFLGFSYTILNVWQLRNVCILVAREYLQGSARGYQMGALAAPRYGRCAIPAVAESAQRFQTTLGRVRWQTLHRTARPGTQSQGHPGAVDFPGQIGRADDLVVLQILHPLLGWICCMLASTRTVFV